MMEYVLDTHALVFHLYDPGSLGPNAKKAFSDPTSKFLIPTMALLEMQYLIEIGKIESAISDCVQYIEQSENMRIVSFAESELADAIAEKGSRDPFDRTILAAARCRLVPIITRDRWMKNRYLRVIW
jgi:PIN domain nuclease of toxin-antitoxin system